MAVGLGSWKMAATEVARWRHLLNSLTYPLEMDKEMTSLGLAVRTDSLLREWDSNRRSAFKEEGGEIQKRTVSSNRLCSSNEALRTARKRGKL
jgi:hypothetical protein